MTPAIPAPSSMQRIPRPIADSPRRGAVLIVVMICLLAVAALAGTLLKLAVTQQRQSRRELRHLQADWLAMAALDRAARELAANPEWTTSEWTPDATLIGDAARVAMHLDQTAAGQTELVATVELGDEDTPTSRVIRRRGWVAPTSDEGATR